MKQRVAKRGIGVQVSGDGNSVVVYAGAAELHLWRKHARQATPKTELELLRVDLRATRLVGREADVAALRDWLADDRQVSVRCITGRAGMGKTRLGIELCALAEQNGWTAGLVDHTKFAAFVAQASVWRWDKPTLVVIDYAAALARDLRIWLENLARPETQQGCPKLRVLLLERHADSEFGWWADLLRPTSFSDPAPDELADPKAPVALASLSAVEDRRALLAETMRLAAGIAGLTPAPRPPPPGADALFDQRLGDDTINNEPLYLMMAGAEAVRSGAPAALALTRIDLAERAAGRERARLGHLADHWRVPAALVAHLAACVTLQGGCGADDALALVEAERLAMNFPATGPAGDLVNRLAEALPGGLGLDAVRPDLIGEAFLLLVLREHVRFPTVQTGIVTRAWERAGARVVATLVRTAQDHAHGNALHPSVMWLGKLVDRIEDFSTLQALVAELPLDTLALRELAATLQTRTAEAIAIRAKDDLESRPVLAVELNNLAVRLAALGRREAALAAAEEAASLYRELAAQRPDAFRPDLAISLNNLANMLSDLGRREAALAAAEEAEALYRDLAAQRPDAFRPDLALSLNTLGNRLSDLGQHEAALAAAEEAEALYRELAAQRPDAFRPDLAMSLNNLANALRDLGRREAALAAANEAVAIRRELAVQRPDAFRPALAASLNNLANELSDLGRREAALAAAEEAAALYRDLAAQQPDAFRPDLATSLNNLATMLSDLGRREAALAAAHEAVAIRRDLAAERPDAFRPNLANSLWARANCLEASDRADEALASNAEAIGCLSPAFAQHPAAFAYRMVPMIRQYLERCERLGREPDAAVLGPAIAVLERQQADEQGRLA